MFEDKCGFIWIGTTGRGLFRLNLTTGKITKVLLQGMDDATILSISIKNNFIWIAWLGGVNKFELPDNCNTDEIKLQKVEFDPQKKQVNIMSIPSLTTMSKEPGLEQTAKGF
ncbi:MAG: hypothetical protein IPJ79_04225 [Bacteroidetes bacterium]|nr:hypothetical protein [Bacteroidota bacterium]